jgi:exopolysaccharide biosynthesis polyprenyl glycosylphosphotransferase
MSITVSRGVRERRPTRPRLPGDGTGPWSQLATYRRRAVLADVASGAAGAAIASWVRFGPQPQAEYVLYSALVPLVWIATIALQRGYENRFLGVGTEEYRRVADSGLLLFVAIAVTSYLLRGDVARGYTVIAVPTTVALTLLLRHRLRVWLARLRRRGHGLQRVLVVGRADAVVSLIEKLDREPEHGMVAIGACVAQEGMHVSHLHDVPVLGDPSQVLGAVDLAGAHVVAVASHPDLSGKALRRLSWDLEERGVELVVSPGIVEVAGPRLSIRPIAGLSLLHLERPALSGGRMLLKAALDRVAAALLLVLLSPLLAAIAIAVKWSSPGPVFFRQTRIGTGGRQFTMLKFRSMVVDAERRRAGLAHLNEGNDVLFKVRHDPRVTRVGAVLRRFSLDELPQLVNVVRGDMSLVGPRPPLPDEVATYTDGAVRRLRVRPGLTGLWQISGRSDLSWEDSLRLDLRYVDNWSLALDVLILWRTWRAVARGAGAY